MRDPALKNPSGQRRMLSGAAELFGSGCGGPGRLCPKVEILMRELGRTCAIILKLFLGPPVDGKMGIGSAPDHKLARSGTRSPPRHVTAAGTVSSARAGDLGTS